MSTLQQRGTGGGDGGALSACCCGLQRRTPSLSTSREVVRSSLPRHDTSTTLDICRFRVISGAARGMFCAGSPSLRQPIPLAARGRKVQTFRRHPAPLCAAEPNRGDAPKVDSGDAVAAALVKLAKGAGKILAAAEEALAKDGAFHESLCHSERN